MCIRDSLRVAKNTWPAEIQKWDHLNGLTWSVVIGTQQERMAALRREADIYLINRENTQWLICLLYTSNRHHFKSGIGSYLR